MTDMVKKMGELEKSVDALNQVRRKLLGNQYAEGSLSDLCQMKKLRRAGEAPKKPGRPS